MSNPICDRPADEAQDEQLAHSAMSVLPIALGANQDMTGLLPPQRDQRAPDAKRHRISKEARVFRPDLGSRREAEVERAAA
jgi:hypothetical protein